MKGRHILPVALAMFCISISSEPASARYGNAILQQLSDAAGIDGEISSCNATDSVLTFQFNGKPLDVRIESNAVSHIGLSLFTPAQRYAIGNQVLCDFIERLAFSEIVFPPEESAHYRLINGININYGHLSDFSDVVADTTLTFSINLEEKRDYHLRWSNSEDPVVDISFPASFRMLTGIKPEEAHLRLREKILSTSPAPRSSSRPDIGMLIPCDSLLGSYKVLKGGNHILSSISDNLYYDLTDSVASLLFGPSYPVESIANLLVSAEMQKEITAKLRMTRYGEPYDEFEVPLNSLLNCMLDEGCHPYFALKKLDSESGGMTALFEMVNDNLGYEHLMSIMIPDNNILHDLPGTIEIRLVPYIPLHDILDMFYR